MSLIKHLVITIFKLIDSWQKEYIAKRHRYTQTMKAWDLPIIMHWPGLIGLNVMVTWSCLMPTVQIRTGYTVTCILCWMSRLTSWITMTSGPTYYTRNISGFTLYKSHMNSIILSKL